MVLGLVLPVLLTAPLPVEPVARAEPSAALSSARAQLSALGTSTGGPATSAVSVLAGNDISWPQCSPALGGYGNPMPDRTARFVVIGLSQGQAFTTNPCLAQQVSWARGRHILVAAYVFPTYPSSAQYAAYGGLGPYSPATVEGRLRNVGWQQAAYWLRAKVAAGLPVASVWVDVEPSKRGTAWTTRPADRNLPVIQGLLAGLAHAGLRTGIYTSSSNWTKIAGGVRLGQAEWRTVGRKSAAEALASCTRSAIQGGPVLLAQYFTSDVDYDLLCPGVATSQRIGQFFTRA